MANIPGAPAAVPPATTPATPPIPREIWVMVVAAIVIAIGFGLIVPVLPQFAKSFNVSDAEAAIVVSAFALMRLVSAPMAGFATNRWGERPVYLTGLGIVALSSAATAFAGSYWDLLVYRGLGGIGSCMFTVASMALVVRLSPPAIRGKVSSAYSSSWLIGTILGPILGGVLAGWAGIKWPFLGYSIALVIAMLVVGLALSNAALRPKAEHAGRPPMLLADGLRDSAYRAVLGGGFATGWAIFGVRIALLPLMLVALLGKDHGTFVASVALTLFALGNGSALLVAGRMSDRLGRRPLNIGGLLITGVATGLIGFASDQALMDPVWFVYVLSVIGGIGAGLLNPAQQAALADVIGNDRSGGKALATFSMVTDMGTIIGPVLGGVISDYLGYGPAFGISGALVVIAGLHWFLAREPHPAHAGGGEGVGVRAAR